LLSETLPRQTTAAVTGEAGEAGCRAVDRCQPPGARFV